MGAEHITLEQHEAEMEELDRSADEVVQFWRAKTRSLEAELQAAQEREKALLKRIEIIEEQRDEARDDLREAQGQMTAQKNRADFLQDALAASPSEKSGSKCISCVPPHHTLDCPNREVADAD